MTAPDPPAFPESLRSKPEFPRPKPPPIVTKKALSHNVPKDTKVSKEDIAGTTHSNEKRHSKHDRNSRKDSKKTKALTIKSPSDGDTIIVSTQDLREDQRPMSADTVQEDSILNLQSYSFADDLIKMPQKINPIRFIDENGKFVKYSDNQDKVADQKIEIQSWEMANLNLARNLQINRHTFLHVFQAYYAGLCLLSLLILPSIGFEKGNDATINNPVFVFYAYYSGISLNTSYVFNFFVTLAALAACDIVLGEKRTVSHRPFSLAFTIKLGIFICCLISIITNSIMVGLDDELYASGIDMQFGGKYGREDWFTDKSNMDNADNDFDLWNTLNIIRGFTGIINWILCSLCLDKTRYWSIVDPEVTIHRDKIDFN